MQSSSLAYSRVAISLYLCIHGCSWGRDIAAPTRMRELPEFGMLPPGALGYVRTKSCTICRAGRDIEYHQLGNSVHLAGDTAAWIAQQSTSAPPRPSMMRGVWGRDERFHPCGVALCDWWEALSNRDRRNWLRERDRPRVIGEDGLYRYFGSGAPAESDDDDDDSD